MYIYIQIQNIGHIKMHRSVGLFHILGGMSDPDNRRAITTNSSISNTTPAPLRDGSVASPVQREKGPGRSCRYGLHAWETRQGSQLLTEGLYNLYQAQTPSERERNGDSKVKTAPATAAAQSQTVSEGQGDSG